MTDSPPGATPRPAAPQPPSPKDPLSRLREALAGRYEVERELGRGGMATVYLARDVKHGRAVAIKVLHPELASVVTSGRFHLEIRTAAQLVHPHVVTLFDSGEAGGLLYYTMPYVAGESLAERLGRTGPLPAPEAVRIASEVTEALAYAHEHGVVHRDVKPANILLADHNHACLADFGLAHALSTASSDRLTATGFAVGSPLYMAPEQITGNGEVDGRADQYGVGCVLFEMLTGRAPFEGDTLESVMMQHLTTTPPRVRSLAPGVPAALEEVVERALAKTPAARFESAAALRAALQESLPAARGRGRRGRPRFRRRTVVAALALSLLAIAGFVWSGGALLAYADYRQGRTALDAWRLGSAEEHFRSALRRDPGYPEAALWLAQTQAWGGVPISEWAPLVADALAASAALAREDRAVGEALGLMATLDFPRACAAYERMRRADSTSFVAWMGLGDCQFRDGAVLPDATSPSGYRFRSSHHRAAQAYVRALGLLPDLHLGIGDGGLLRIRELLHTSPTRLRGGRLEAAGGGHFLAYPSWAGDTLAFVPYPAAEVFDAQPHTSPATTLTAVLRQRELLRAMASGWVRSNPESPGALEGLAVSLELLGDPAALDTLRRARALTSDREERRRLMGMEAWQRLKFATPGDTAAYRRVRLLADSVLREPGFPAEEEARRMGGLAALTGRVSIAARIARAAPIRMSPGDSTRNPELERSSSALLAFAAMGAPADTLRALTTLVESAIRNSVAPEQQPEARYRYLGRATTLAFPTVPLDEATPLPSSGDYLVEAQQAYARGDLTAVRAIFDRLEGFRRARPAAERAFDGLYPEASLLRAIGSPERAIDWLDPTLAELRWTEPESIADAVPAGAFVRAVALRARLAHETGDRATAARWAAVVSTLWSDAEPPLHPMLAEMRQLAARR